MDTSNDHAAYLARRDFVIPPGDFTPDERDLLAKYGRWLEALAAGALAPTTPNQELFVRTARGEREPETAFERAWAKVERERAVGGEVTRAFQALGEARKNASRLEAEYLAARAQVLQAVREQLDSVDEVFAEQLRAANDLAAKTEQVVRDLVMRVGRSYSLAGIRATYQKARVSWDNEKLTAYAEQHPDVLAFRKLGKPTVALRFADAAPSEEASGPPLPEVGETSRLESEATG
jgi:uncharacterized protein YifE (UPF0438 family)